MAEAGIAVPPACAHVPGSVSYSPPRQGYIISCGRCMSALAMIPNEWPVAESLGMWSNDDQRMDYLREADRLQQAGTLCICGRRPQVPALASGSKCGQCNPNAMRLTPVAQESYGSSPGAEALAKIQQEVIIRAVDRLTNPPALVDDSAIRKAYQQNEEAQFHIRQNAFLRQEPKLRHGIEDVRHKGGSTAFRCVCGWGISQQFAKTVFDAHGETELIRMLETHMAGGQVGPTIRPKPEWAAPLFVQVSAAPFWKTPIFKQVWQTPIMSEPAFTPRRRIILEE